MADVRRLPMPVVQMWDWQLRGACRDLDSSVFFHPDRERGPIREARERRAKLICRRCPVLEQCRRHALMVHEPYGVWGGLSASERDDIIRAGRGGAAVAQIGRSSAVDSGSGPRPSA